MCTLTHHLGFDAQTTKPSNTWFWGSNQQTLLHTLQSVTHWCRCACINHSSHLNKIMALLNLVSQEVVNVVYIPFWSTDAKYCNTNVCFHPSLFRVSHVSPHVLACMNCIAWIAVSSQYFLTYLFFCNLLETKSTKLKSWTRLALYCWSPFFQRTSPTL
jgi:hypothetical protein